MHLEHGTLSSAPARVCYPVPLSTRGYRLQCISNFKKLQRYSGEIEALRLRSSSPFSLTAQPEWLLRIGPLPGCTLRTLLLRHNGQLQAVIYLNEKVVAGIPTGYFRGSGIKGETLILCEAGREAQLLALAAEVLLEDHRGFLVLLQQCGDESLSLVNHPGLSIQTTNSTLYWRAPLQQDFDTTIANFGHRTRRNMRHSTRYADKAGWRFLRSLDQAQLTSAFYDLAGRSTYPLSPATVAENLQLALRTPGWFAMGLVDHQNRWLSSIVGCRTPEGTDIFWQLNATGYKEISLCITMRTMMMHEEIRRRSPRIRYIGGTCEFMQHCCEPNSSRQTTLARPGLRLWLLKTLLRSVTIAAPFLRPHIL